MSLLARLVVRFPTFAKAIGFPIYAFVAAQHRFTSFSLNALAAIAPPVFQCNPMGVQNIVVVGGASAVKEALSSPKTIHRRSMDFSQFGVHSILDSGDHPLHWRAMRRSLMSFFQNEMVKMAPLMAEELRKEARVWARTGPQDLFRSFIKFTVDFQFKILFGHTVQEHREGCGLSFYEVCNLLTMDGFCPVRCTAWFREEVCAALVNAPAGTIGCHLMDLQADPDSECTFQMAWDTASVLALALTPGFSMFWTVTSLLEHPKDLAKARVSKAYLEQCLKESLRLYAPVQLVFPRVAVADTTIDGQPVSKGSLIAPSINVAHRSKDNWGQSAERFDPTRWASLKPAATCPVSSSRGPRGEVYIPFNAGPHQCPGRFFIYPAMLGALETLITDFELTVEDDRGLFSMNGMDRLALDAGGYFHPARDVLVRVCTRDDRDSGP